MAKEGSREQQLREMREQQFVAPTRKSRPSGPGHNKASKPDDSHSDQPHRAGAGTKQPGAGAKPKKATKAAAKVSVGRTGSSTLPTGAKPKRGPPRIEDRDKTLTATKPWVALGMSRRSWYRRQAEKSDG